MIIKKSFLKDVLTLSIFFFSFFNSVSLFISLILLFSLFFDKEIGAIKILNLITFRTVINPGLAVDLSNFEIIKWIAILSASCYLVFSFFKLDNLQRRELTPVLIFIFLFYFYTIISSFIFSSLPTVALFKISSYIIPFFAIIVGIYLTREKIDWMQWLFKVFFLVGFLSVFLIPLPIGYLRNSVGFQGILNHPNLFGIVMVLFFSLTITKYTNKRFQKKIYFYLLEFSIIILIFLSKSRTSFLSVIIILILFFILDSKKNMLYKYLIFLLLLLIFLTYIIMDPTPLESLQSFLYKGQENGNIFFSREQQAAGIIGNFMKNPFFGTGFGVPVTNFRSFAFSFDAVVEPGNLIFAVLSYGGIFGLIFFFMYMLKIIHFNLKNLRKQIYLPLAAILISMGEMVFFSTNNIGVWLYMLIAIYMFYPIENN
ncbi:O-antigen ligase family protein [Enterococcus entomosocium]|jgi:O-antigen ligase|uniref:O-antigen ligase family protein n=1 Tax=Enterococcus entomosocium TaxID=3034352 RepID=UPI003D6A015E